MKVKCGPLGELGYGWEGLTHGDYSRSLSASLRSSELIGL